WRWAWPEPWRSSAAPWPTGPWPESPSGPPREERAGRTPGGADRVPGGADRARGRGQAGRSFLGVAGAPGTAGTACAPAPCPAAPCPGAPCADSPCAAGFSCAPGAGARPSERISQPAPCHCRGSSTLRPSIIRGAATSAAARAGSRSRYSSHSVSSTVSSAPARARSVSRSRVTSSPRRRRVFSSACGSATVTSAPAARNRVATSRAGATRVSSAWGLAGGLARGAEHRDASALEVAEQLAGQVHHAGAAAVVDGVDLAQEAERLGHAVLLGARAEGADVLGQAASAEADAGAEELRADAVVHADRAGHVGDVRTGDLAHLGDGVDEGDLRGQEGVGGDLHQLRGLVAHHQAGCLALE